jgi:MgtC family protein
MLAAELLGNPTLPLPIVVLRMAGAVGLCALIGFKREAAHRFAGLRIHMLVGLAAAIHALLTLHLVDLHAERGDTVRMDPVRLVEALTAGIAVLAAGMIMLSRGGQEPHHRRRPVARRSDRPGGGGSVWTIAARAALLGLAIATLRSQRSDGPE